MEKVEYTAVETSPIVFFISMWMCGIVTTGWQFWNLFQLILYNQNNVSLFCVIHLKKNNMK